MKKTILAIVGIGLFLISGCAASAPTPTPTPAPTEDVPYVPNGDSLQKLDVFLPGEADGGLPTVFIVAGRHFGSMNKRDPYARVLARHFVELNYSAVVFSSRLAYPEAYQDMFCALAWTRANADAYGFDPERIVVLGDGTAATYAAMLGTVDDPTLYLEGCPHPLPEADWVQGVVAINGLYDFTSDNVGFQAKNVIALFLGGEFSEFPGLWAEASPISWLDGSEPPFLLIHPLEDPELLASEAENFAAALEGAGVEVEMLLVQAGHDFFSSSNPASALALDAVDAFLAALFEG